MSEMKMDKIEEGKQVSAAEIAATPSPSEALSKADSSRKSNKNKKRSSSIFSKARMSFVRSGGERGATVETLRGKTGADFEAQGRIHRAGGVGIGSACCGGCFGIGNGGEKEAKKERLLLIKGPFCFVFKNEDAPSPKYAIGLQSLKAVAKQGHPSVAELQTNLGDVEYEVIFDNEENAKKFRSVVRKQAAAAETEMVRKRLGHEHLLRKHSKSVRYAESIAKKKVKDQPDAPITAGEVVENMPITHMP